MENGWAGVCRTNDTHTTGLSEIEVGHVQSDSHDMMVHTKTTCHRLLWTRTVAFLTLTMTQHIYSAQPTLITHSLRFFAPVVCSTKLSYKT